MAKKKNKDQLGFFDEVEKPVEKVERWKVKNPMESIKSPWTEEQVILLNRFQNTANVHPFTCLICHDTNLFARTDGWICPNCDYTQNWAMSLMMDIEFIERAEKWHLKISQEK